MPRRRDSRGKGGGVSGPFSDAVMVVHGPEAFDQGDVAWLLGLLSPGRTVVAGVMARTAAEESGLPVAFDGDVPSSVIRRTGGKIFLVNHGKTRESGRIFGEIVASRLPLGQPLVQLECSSRTVYLWNGSVAELGFARLLADRTGFRLVTVASDRQPGEGVREIRGCIPGEAVLVEGIVIGTATGETVAIRSARGGIEAVSGLRPKPHGLEKLARMGQVDLPSAWCKSGPIRRAPPRRGGAAPPEGRVLVVDHCGKDLYRSIAPDTCGVLAIGDDTTAVCGHICAHRGIPVFGVVDGDPDGLLAAGFAPGSVIAEVLEGSDDETGRELAASVSCGGMVNWESWVADALKHLGDRCRIRHPQS
ncbi:MAG TPA: DUF2117 domain-containing protein [Methanomicrobiales archaeon]|nr:DUF2117 domain-containing protein [Methanomicrobiales archaeon]